MKIGRNDKCWCGSGKKFKQCHLPIEEKIAKHYHQGDEVPTRELLKTKEQIEGIRHAGKINTMVLDKIAEVIKEGMSTEELNKIAHEYTIQLGGTPAPLNYHGFPKSICTSINEVVCHGIPSDDEVLKSGDIVNVDVTTIVNGYYADASRMFMIGEVDEEKQKLVRIAKECLDLGLAEATSKIGSNVFAIFSSSARLSPSEPSMSERLMVNCKTAIPFPSITFGRFASVGRIHWSEKVSTGSDCRSLATNKVSIIPHDAHPSTETNASI